MKNFVFLSPNFPENYRFFCRELKANGLNVLGIGDCPYDELSPVLKESLTEYYKVSSLENYEEVYRACGYFIHRYGRIDWLESNNEYWLERDAALRTGFHITSGFQTEDMSRIKYKSQMKAYYERIGLPVARYHMVDDEAGCLDFTRLVGYPVIVKPDNGVGASHTYRLRSDEELLSFLREGWDGRTSYIMEEYVDGTVCSYDAVIDSHGEPLFEAGNVTVASIMDIVNDADNCKFYIVKDLPDDVRAAGRATVKAFGVRSRFIHFEFFRLDRDMESLGKKGDLVGLEVNMRPSGGISPDLMNFARSTDVYKIWADMIAFDRSTKPEGQHYYAVYAGRRDGKDFVLSDDEVRQKYGPRMKMDGRVADALSDAMGNRMFVCTFDTEDEVLAYYRDVLSVR